MGGGGKYQLNNRFNYPSIDLQLFADIPLNYNKVDNPYEFYLTKPTYTRGDIKTLYDLRYYFHKIPNYSIITTLPDKNAEYIKEALPNVTDCNSMLYSCGSLISIDTTGWDTSKIENMDSMFFNCKSLRSLDISNWDTSKVTNMNSMFYNCGALLTIKGIIDMKSCTEYKYMFKGCYIRTVVKIKNPPADFETKCGLRKDQYEIVS